MQWQRAETLGALVNGVFLVALCVSIFLEAIQRFVEPQEVKHPIIILIVGCCGLASNIIGLFLFHDHGHSHGHSHGHGSSHEQENSQSNVHSDHDGIGAAEEGQSLLRTNDGDGTNVADEGGNIEDVLPENRIGNWPLSGARQRSVSIPKEQANGSQSNLSRGPSTRQAIPRKNHSRSRSRGFSSVDDLYVHPASFRHEIIAASRLENVESESGSDEEYDHPPPNRGGHLSEESPLLNHSKHPRKNSEDTLRKSTLHDTHKHAQPKDHSHESSGHGHSHGDLNMKGVFLHVLGDALGNVGVILTALFIWLTPFSWRFYSDPLISLIITVIILCSAIPLCKAASRILLQAVPTNINIDDIKSDINQLPGIISCHHVHVWQLSDTKLVASLHVQVAFDFKGQGSARYMALARAVRDCLHEYGIHSSTIQPEFCLDPSHSHDGNDPDVTLTNSDDSRGAGTGGVTGATSSASTPNPKPTSCSGSRAASLQNEPTCLLECGDECGTGQQCCAPGTIEGPSGANSSGNGSGS
jgi:solute carrier family 30 (zinc transporter), member 1